MIDDPNVCKRWYVQHRTPYSLFLQTSLRLTTGAGLRIRRPAVCGLAAKHAISVSGMFSGILSGLIIRVAPIPTLTARAVVKRRYTRAIGPPRPVAGGSVVLPVELGLEPHGSEPPPVRVSVEFLLHVHFAGLFFLVQPAVVGASAAAVDEPVDFGVREVLDWGRRAGVS